MKAQGYCWARRFSCMAGPFSVAVWAADVEHAHTAFDKFLEDRGHHELKSSVRIKRTRDPDRHTIMAFGIKPELDDAAQSG